MYLHVCLISNFLLICLGELQLLQTLFRHGDRVRDGVTTIGFNFYPNDPWPLDIWSPLSEGALTNVCIVYFIN